MDSIIRVLFIYGLINSNFILEMSLLLGFLDIKDIYKELEKYFNVRGLVAAWSNFFKLVLMILTFAHFAACLWHYIAVYELEENSK